MLQNLAFFLFTFKTLLSKIQDGSQNLKGGIRKIIRTILFNFMEEKLSMATERQKQVLFSFHGPKFVYVFFGIIQSTLALFSLAKPLYLSWSHSGTQYMTQQTSFSFMVPLSSFSSESKKAEWLTGWLTGFRGGGSVKRKSTIQYERNLLRYRPQLFQKLKSFPLIK